MDVVIFLCTVCYVVESKNTCKKKGLMLLQQVQLEIVFVFFSLFHLEGPRRGPLGPVRLSCWFPPVVEWT